MKPNATPKQVDCPNSFGSSCKLVSQKLGFSVGVSIEGCNKCLEQGIDSPESTALRARVEDVVLYRIRTDPAIANKVKAFSGWQKAQITWKAAGAWLKSKTSRVLGPIPLHVLETRKTSCFGRVGSEACPMLRKHTDGFHYCASCGCGVREDARLDGNPSKLEFPYLQCPLGRPGFSNEAVPDRLLRQIPPEPDADPRRSIRSVPFSQQVGQEAQPQLPPPAG